MNIFIIVGITATPHFKFYVSMSKGFDYKRVIDPDEVVNYIASKITLSSEEIVKITDFQKLYEYNRPLVGKNNS